MGTLAQYVGGMIGIGLASICMWQWNVDPALRTIPVLEPATNCGGVDDDICASESMIGAFIVEMICSFFFILIILMVKDPITAPSKEGYECCWTHWCRFEPCCRSLNQHL